MERPSGAIRPSRERIFSYKILPAQPVVPEDIPEEELPQLLPTGTDLPEFFDFTGNKYILLLFLPGPLVWFIGCNYRGKKRKEGERARYASSLFLPSFFLHLPMPEVPLKTVIIIF